MARRVRVNVRSLDLVNFNLGTITVAGTGENRSFYIHTKSVHHCVRPSDYSAIRVVTPARQQYSKQGIIDIMASAEGAMTYCPDIDEMEPP